MLYSANKTKANWRVMDGKAVVINTETTHYYSLNQTGAFVWNLLVDERLGADEIVERVQAHFSRADGDVAGEVRALLDVLVREGLVSATEADGRTDSR